MAIESFLNYPPEAFNSGLDGTEAALRRILSTGRRIVGLFGVIPFIPPEATIYLGDEEGREEILRTTDSLIQDLVAGGRGDRADVIIDEMLHNPAYNAN